MSNGLTVAADVAPLVQSMDVAERAGKDAGAAIVTSMQAADNVVSELKRTVSQAGYELQRMRNQAAQIRPPRISGEMRDDIRRFEAGRRLRADREARFIEPARIRGLDTTDQAIVTEARQARAAELRALRAERRTAEARERTAAAVASARATLAQMEQQRIRQQAVQMDEFRSKMDRIRAVEAQALERRQNMINSGRILGVAAIGAAYYAANASQQYRQNVMGIGSAGVDFEGAMRPLMALGGNLQTPGAMRERVMNLSTSIGSAPADVAAALFQIESGTANFDPKRRQQLVSNAARLTQVTGGTLTENAEGLISYLQNFGNLDPQRAAARLFTASERGRINAQQVSRFAGMVLPVAQGAGLSDSEALGLYTGISQTMGGGERTQTAVRAIVQRMPKLQEHGVELGSNLVETIQRMERLPNDVLLKVFGEEAIAGVQVMRKNVENIRAEIEAIKNASPVVLEVKRNQQLTDPFTQTAQLGATLQAMRDQIPIQKLQDPAMRADFINTMIGEIGYERHTPESGKAVTPQAFREAAIKWGTENRGSAQYQAIVSELVSRAQAAGDSITAESLKLQFGEQFGLRVRAPEQQSTGSKVVNALLNPMPVRLDQGFAGPNDVPDFLAAQRRDPSLTASQYASRRMADALNQSAENLRDVTAEMKRAYNQRPRNPGQ